MCNRFLTFRLIESQDRAFLDAAKRVPPHVASYDLLSFAPCVVKKHHLAPRRGATHALDASSDVATIAVGDDSPPRAAHGGADSALAIWRHVLERHTRPMLLLTQR